MERAKYGKQLCFTLVSSQQSRPLSTEQSGKMLEWITEHQDGINLFLIKLTGTALTLLTIIGYLDAVSSWSWLLNIHIIVFAIILLMINLLGYSVYLIKMKRDSASDATLLNHLYTGMAIINQVNSTVMFIITLGDILVPIDSDIYIIIIEFALKFLIFLSIGNLVAVTGATLFKHLSPAGYLGVSQNRQIIMIIFVSKIFITLSTFLLSVWMCDRDISCVGVSQKKVWAPLGLICFLVLFKIADDNYKITMKMKVKLRKVLRTNNSVSPEVIQNGTGNQVIVMVSIFNPNLLMILPGC